MKKFAGPLILRKRKRIFSGNLLKTRWIYCKVADLTVKSVPTVTVKGKGNFTGSVPVQFEIVPSSLDSVTATATDIVYANKANLCKPTKRFFFDTFLILTDSSPREGEDSFSVP